MAEDRECCPCNRYQSDERQNREGRHCGAHAGSALESGVIQVTRRHRYCGEVYPGKQPHEMQSVGPEVGDKIGEEELRALESPTAVRNRKLVRGIDLDGSLVLVGDREECVEPLLVDRGIEGKWHEYAGAKGGCSGL